MKMEDGELNSLIEGLSNTNQNGQLVLTQQLQQSQNPQTHFVVSPYATNSYLSTSDSPFPTPSPSPSIILRSPAPVKSPITNLQNIKSPIPVKSPGFQNVKSPSQSFQNVKSPTANFQNVKSPSLYQVKSPGVANIKSPASGVVKSPANIRSPGVCNPQSPAQAHSPFQHQVSGSPNNNRSPAPPPPTPSPTAPSPARPNTPQPVVNQYPPNASNASQHVQFSQSGPIVGRTQMTCGGPQSQIQKAKQPLQILPKPLTATTQKQTVPRLNASSIPQQAPLLINQPQNASPALVLNQVLTSGAPVLVQPAGPGGTVHLMLRPPTPSLQSGPGPPQNKMIITNATQPQAQATVLIPNRQQVMRIMTAQGPMHLQQIQTPSGPQFIAIPQNQALSFPPNSVLLQSSPSNAIQVQPNSANTLQLQQNANSTIQLQQNASGVLQSSTFPQSSLPLTSNPIAVPNQLLQSSASNSANISTVNKRDEKGISTDSLNCSLGVNEQKKIVIDNKIHGKKNSNTVNSNNSNYSNVTGGLNNSNALGSNISVNNKKSKNVKGKSDDETLNKNFTKADVVVTSTTSVPSTTQKNITSTLRQVRPGAFANRNRQNQNNDAKDKTDEINSKSLTNLTRIIDSVASNTEHLISSPPPKIDNLTATINSVAENIKSPVQEEIVPDLTFSDVFLAGNKTLSLNKRPNLTIVQKQNKTAPPEPSEEPNLTINRLILSPSSHPAADFGNIDNCNSLELSGVMTSAGVQTNDNRSFAVDQSSSSSISGFANQDESKKGKKKTSAKKKGKKEENRVDLWDLMKSAGIGDDEFDEPTDVGTFPQDNLKIADGLEISSADSELLAQLQSAQLPNNIRVIVGEDGRPVFINGSNVLVPDAVHTGAATCAAEPSEADSVLQNMILPDNVFNFTPQALATAQTQLNQLIQDHGGLTTSSADQQLLSQIFGSPTTSISTTPNNSNVVTSGGTSSSSVHPSSAALLTSTQSHPSLTGSGNDPLTVNCSPVNSDVARNNIGKKQETKSDFIGGPPPGLSSLGPDSLVITNNNGVPTLVASPALMQYLQTHQGIIQFQHDPVTKTIQPSLIIPHPHSKIELATATQDIRNDKISTIVGGLRNVGQTKEMLVTKSRSEQKSSVGTTTEDPKNIAGAYNVLAANQVVPNVVKLNTIRFVKDNPPLLQIASETNNLITFKESNKGLSEKDAIEIDRKIQHNRALLDQCRVMGNCRTGQSGPGGVPNALLKDGLSNEAFYYQLSTVTSAVDKFGNSASLSDNKTTETQTLDDLHHLDVGTIKGMQTAANISSPTPNSDFQTKFLESIGMANKVTKSSVGTGTTSSPNASAQASVQTSPLKRGRKKKGSDKADKIEKTEKTEKVDKIEKIERIEKVEKIEKVERVEKIEKTEKMQNIQNQGTQVDGKMEMTFNIAQLTPEQNLKLNQALQSRGVTASQVHNFDAIKQIIQEEIRKITAGTLQNTSIRFVSTPSFQVPSEDTTDSSDQSIPTPNVLYNNQNLNQILDQSSNQGNIISLQGNDVVAINSGNQRIFASQNQLLSSGHLVTSNNQILAIGGNHNQLVSLGNPINSSNQIVTLGNTPNVMSMNGNNVPGPGSVIVGSNGNVVAIVHQSPASNQASSIVQRLQTIQLTTPKHQHFKSVQDEIQTLSLKTNRTTSEELTLQKLIFEQQKILSTGRLLSAAPGSLSEGFHVVSQSVTTQSTRFQQQTTQLTQHVQSQSVQSNSSQQQSQVQQMYITTSASPSNVQPCKTSFTTQSAVSCGTSTSDINNSPLPNVPKMTVPPTLMISDVPTSTYGPLYVSPNTSGKNVTKCEKGTSPIQIQMGTQTVSSMEYRSGKMSTGTMTSPNTGKPQAVVAPAIVIQQNEVQSPTWQMKPRNQQQQQQQQQQQPQLPQQQQPQPQQQQQQQQPQPSTSPLRNQVPALSRTAFIEQQMRTDQTGATMPDTRTPFLSKSDACKRLIRYHVMDEKGLSVQDLAAADEMFEATAQHLLDKFRVMKEKYKYLLMLESMREVSTAERIMVDRNFIIEERIELEELREKEKRLQEEFENPTICYSSTGEATLMKTELTFDDGKGKRDMSESYCSDEVKYEKSDDESDLMKSKVIHDSMRDNPLKSVEGSRGYDYKECKIGRRNRSRSRTPENEDFDYNISSKCKMKSNRTFSDGSSKSSLDSSKDEDSGTDINAQVQSAIDSILNLQKCDTFSNSADDCLVTPKKKKKRKHGDRSSESSKKSKTRERNSSEESDYDDGCGSDADHLLDEAIRSIMTS